MSGAPKKGFSLAEVRGGRKKNQGLHINSMYAMGSAFHSMAKEEHAAKKADEARDEELFGEVKPVKLTREEKAQVKADKLADKETNRQNREKKRNEKMQKAAEAKKEKATEKANKGNEVGKGESVEDEEPVEEGEGAQIFEDDDEQEVVSMVRARKALARPAAQKASKNPVFQRKATAALRPVSEDEGRIEGTNRPETDSDDNESAEEEVVAPATTAASKSVTEPLSKRATTARSDPNSKNDGKSLIDETIQSEADKYDVISWANNVVNPIEAAVFEQQTVSERAVITPACSTTAGQDDSADGKAGSNEKTDTKVRNTPTTNLAPAKNPAPKAAPKSILKQVLDNHSRVTKRAQAPRKRRAEQHEHDEGTDDSSEDLPVMEADQATKQPTKPAASKTTKETSPKEAPTTYQGTVKRTAAARPFAAREAGVNRIVGPSTSTGSQASKPTRPAAALTAQQKLHKAAAADRAYVKEMKASAATARPARRAGRGTVGVKLRGITTTHESRPFFSESEEDEENESDGVDFLGVNDVVGSVKKSQRSRKSTAGAGQRGVAKKVDKKTVGREEAEEDEGEAEGTDAKKRAYGSDDEREVEEEKMVGKKAGAAEKPARKKTRGDAGGAARFIW